MKICDRAIFSLILSVVFLSLSCRKNDKSIQAPKDSRGKWETEQISSVEEICLFVIHGSDGTDLTIKTQLGNVLIYNNKPGTALGGSDTYQIADSYGKVYNFGSSTNFGGRTETGLFGLVRIFKNGGQIFKEQYPIDKKEFVCGTIDIPPPTASSDGDRMSGVSSSRYYWPNGSTITAKFIDRSTVSDAVKRKIEHYAHQWEQYANIKFEFVPSNQRAQIKIYACNKGGSYTKGVGTDLKLFIKTRGSFNMKFGWFDDDSSDIEIAETVLHEFGHALGLEHEHQHKRSTINLSRYISHLMQACDWSYLEARSQAASFNWLEKKISSIKFSKEYDPLSIMHYEVPADCTTDGIAVGGSSSLSEGDKEYIQSIYPKP